MPRIRRQANYRNASVSNIVNGLPSLNTIRNWSRNNKQNGFNRAMAILAREPLTANNRRAAVSVLTVLAALGHKWNNVPSSESLLGYFQSLQPNYSRVARHAQKWHDAIRSRPTRAVNLPKNGAKNAISLYNFRPGNEAVMIVRRNALDHEWPRFYQIQSIKNLVAPKSFNVLMRKGQTETFLNKEPMNRRRVLRRNVTHIRFSPGTNNRSPRRNG